VVPIEGLIKIVIGWRMKFRSKKHQRTNLLLARGMASDMITTIVITSICCHEHYEECKCRQARHIGEMIGELA
jgi:hypothetical protein